jgi:hypothetical protein
LSKRESRTRAAALPTGRCSPVSSDVRRGFSEQVCDLVMAAFLGQAQRRAIVFCLGLDANALPYEKLHDLLVTILRCAMERGKSVQACHINVCACGGEILHEFNFAYGGGSKKSAVFSKKPVSGRHWLLLISVLLSVQSFSARQESPNGRKEAQNTQKETIQLLCFFAPFCGHSSLWSRLCCPKYVIELAVHSDNTLLYA